MRYILLLLTVLITLASFDHQAPTIKASELKPWLGNWKGTLTYKDYSSGKPTTINATMKFGPIVDGSKLVVAEGYPDEPSHDGTDTLQISADGTYINDNKLASKKKTADTFQFVLENEGEDAGQKAEIRITYSFSKSRFTRKKEIRYRGQADYFVRNEYKMVRQ